MHFEVAWVVASSGTQAQPKIILEPGYLPDYLSVSYDYVFILYVAYLKSVMLAYYGNPTLLLTFV